MKYEGVWAYRSSDLLNWQFVGQILPDISGVIYIDAPTSGTTLSTITMSDGGRLIPQSTRGHSHEPIAQWSLDVGQPRIESGRFRLQDSNLFLLPDTGIAYAVYTDGNQDKTYVTQLSPDFQSGWNRML